MADHKERGKLAMRRTWRPWGWASTVLAILAGSCLLPLGAQGGNGTIMAVYARGTSAETYFPVKIPTSQQQTRINSGIAEANRLQPGTAPALAGAQFGVFSQLPAAITKREGGGQSGYALTDENGNDLVLIENSELDDDLFDANNQVLPGANGPALGFSLLIWHESQHIAFGDQNNGLTPCQHAGLYYQEAQAAIDARAAGGSNPYSEESGLPAQGFCGGLKDTLNHASMDASNCAKAGGTPTNPDGSAFSETELPQECEGQ